MTQTLQISLQEYLGELLQVQSQTYDFFEIKTIEQKIASVHHLLDLPYLGKTAQQLTQLIHENIYRSNL